MGKKDILKTVIKDFHHRDIPELHPREIEIPLNLNKIVTLIGARRSGKTYILYQTINRLLEEVEKSYILFINFEDERLNLKSDELDLILQAYMELYPEQKLDRCYFFFDEIQNVPDWEKFVRRLYDSISKNIFLTGSNAKMLSSEIATSLRGRSISYEVYPLNFREYLNFKGIAGDLYVSETKGSIYHSLETYLSSGGFPELILISDKEIRLRILQEYFDVMLFRDLIERYDIKNTIALKFFLKRIFASSTKQISINKIYNELKSAGIKIGKNSLYDYLQMAESVFMFKTIKKYSPKISTQELGEKKVYAIDNGLMSALTMQFSSDVGKMMEQVVFWELRRRGADIYFLKNGFECDFVTVSKDGRQKVIQVTYDMTNPETSAREIKGLVNAAKKLNLTNGIIITYDSADRVEEKGITIDLIPLPRFLLEN